MLSQKSPFGVSVVRQASRHTLPAFSVAGLSRIASAVGMNSTLCTLPMRTHAATALAAQNNVNLYRPHTIPQLNCRWLSTHPICDPIDCEIANDLSTEEFDSECVCVCMRFFHPYTMHTIVVTCTNVSHDVTCACRCLQIRLSSA